MSSPTKSDELMPHGNYDKLREMILGRMAINNVTRKQMADFMGVKSLTTVSKKLKEPKNITLLELAGISRGLKIPFDDLKALIPELNSDFE